MNNKNIFLNLVLLTFLCACNGKNGTSVDIEQKQPRPLNTTLTSVNVVNNQLIIRGTGLSSVTRVQLTGSGTTGTYDVVSATANEIVVNAASAVMIGVGRTLDLLISNAEAQASFSITFDLNNNAVLSQHINDMGASAGQVLKFNGTNWVPGSLPSSQMYLGSFDANSNIPDLSSPSSNAGDYYIVSVAGTFNSIAYNIGDWIISDGVAWQRIANAAPAVTSFEGRQGAVVLVPGDYVSLLNSTTLKLTGSSLNDIADINTTGISANKILKFDGTAWVIADDLVGGGAGSVGTAELQNTSVTYQKMNLTDGDVPQAKITGLVTAFTNVNTSLSGKIGLGNLSATSPLAYNNGTGAFTISAASTTAAGTISATDKTKLDSLELLSSGDGLLERFSGVLRSNTCTAGQILKWNAVSGWTCSSDSNTDTTKLPLAGGTLTGNLAIDTALQLKDGAAASYVTLKAPASGTTSYTLTFPPSVGAANQVLTTNAAGILSWTSVGTATSVGGDLTGTIANASIATDAITTSKVLDGTLINADINVSAAIAQSKVANLTTDLSTITTNVAGKIGLTNLSATAPLFYNNTTGAFTVSAATTTLPGSMSAADKTKLDSVSTVELDYLVGVTSDVQTQLDAKFAKAGGTLTGDLLLDTQLRLKDGATSNYVTLKAPASGTTSYSLTFPAAVGSANQVLTTNALGVLSWTTVATSSTAVGGDLTGTIASATIAADAVTSAKIIDGTLVNADINASAAIAQSKVANLTTDLSTITTNVAGKIGLTNLSATAPLVYNNSTGAFTVNAATTTLPGAMSAADKTKIDSVSTIELDYLAGVTSDIQTQLDTKFAKAGGTLTGDLLLDTQLRLKDGATANYVTLKAPPTGTTSYTLTFPAAVGSANQVLTTNATGVLSWTTIGTATSVGGDLTGTVANAVIAADAVTSAKIIDGTLVNADINASAAIAQSKVANLTTDLSTITTNVAGKIGLTNLSATAPLVYNNTTGAFTVSAASTTADGTLSAADKTKLNGLEALSAGNGLFERFSGVVRSNTCAAGEVLKWNAVSGWICGTDNATDATKLPLAGGTLTGNLIVNTELQLKDGSTANYVTLKAPATGTTSYTLTFPATVGSANQVLTTNATGVLSWTTVATSSTAVGGDLTGTISSATIAANAITSAKIIDGTLVDDDINASAAIAQSKVANLTTDLSTITSNVAGKIGLTNLTATAPLVYNNSTGAFTMTPASGTVPGSMSAADKTKLDQVSSTELDYLVGVTSDVQTQIETKFAKGGGTLTGDLLLDTQLRLKDGATANYVTLKAPASGTTSYTLTFPAAVGSANQVLTTNALGVLSWTSVGTATAVGGDLTGTIASATIAADAVTSAKILDGTLVNADINASAAIAQSKVANLTTDLAGKIGLTNLSATAPLVYNNTTGVFTVSAATTTDAGTMSATDKTKINALEILSSGAGLFERFSGSIESNTCTAGQVLVWNAVGGWICSEVVSAALGTVTPSSVAIATGDSIGDAFNKAQGQIDLKAPLASPTLTGVPTTPNASAGTNTTQIANTAFVAAASATWKMLGSDIANSTTTMAEITGLSFPVTAGVTYEFEFFIVFTGPNTNTGSRWSVFSAQAIDFLHYQSEYSLTTTTVTNNTLLSGYDLPATANATNGVATGNIAIIKGIYRPATSGTFMGRFASENTGTITAKAGKSYVRYKALN